MTNMTKKLTDNIEVRIHGQISINPKNDNEYIIVDSSEQDDWYFVRHSWNSLNGTHFDLTKPFLSKNERYLRHPIMSNPISSNDKKMIQMGMG